MNSEKMLKEIERIMEEEKNNDCSCISLDDVRELFKTIKQNYEDLRRMYKEKFKRILQVKSLLSRPYYCDIKEFDYVNNVLQFEFDFFGVGIISFRKRANGDLYISSKKSALFADKILVLLGSELSILYDEFMKYKDFYKQHNYAFHSVNSSFLIDISSDGLWIKTEGFNLASYNSFANWECRCNSEMVNSTIRGKEEEISQKIFIRIEDCPLWSQQLLSFLRQEQIKEQQRLEYKSRRKLEFTKKFFPWMKKEK